MNTYVNKEKLSNFVKLKRGSRGLKEVCEESGRVHPCQINRVEKCQDVYTETFLAICDWLDLSPTEFFTTIESEN